MILLFPPDTNLSETEGALRSWLRANANITAIVSDRTYFSMPQQDRPELPLLIHYRIGGGSDEFMQEYPDFIIESWGVNKFEASTLATIVASEIQKSHFKAPVVIDEVEIISGTVNIGPLPLGGVDWAKRYRLDVTFQMRNIT